MNKLSSNLALSLATVMAVVGALDAFIGRQWDFLALFLFIGVLLVVLWLRQRAGRVPATLRPDVAQWIEHQSQLTGESFEDITDRALSAYRMGLVDQDRT